MKHFLLRTTRLTQEDLRNLLNVKSFADIEILLDKYLEDPEIRSALFFFNASDTYQKFLNYKSTGSNPGIIIACFKMLLRMSARPTPAGPFSGVSLGHWSDHSQLPMKVAEGPPLRIRAEYDVINYYFAKSKKAWITQNYFVANPSAFPRGDSFEFIDFPNSIRRRGLSFARYPRHPSLEALLALMKKPTTFQKLAQQTGASGREQKLKLKRWLEHLIQNQIVFEEPIEALIGDSRKNSQFKILKNCQPRFTNKIAPLILNTLKTNDFQSSLPEAHLLIEKEFKEKGWDLIRSPFHCDWIRGGNPRLHHSIYKKTQSVIRTLEENLSRHFLRHSTTYHLSLLREEFQVRFADRKVPLLTIFQEGSPFLKYLHHQFDNFHEFPALRKIQTEMIESLRGKSKFHFDLSPDWLKQLKEVDQDLNIHSVTPSGWNAIVQIHRPTVNSELLQLQNIFGGPGGRMLSSYCEFFPELEVSYLQEIERLKNLDPMGKDWLWLDLGFRPEGAGPNYMRRPKWSNQILALNSIEREFRKAPVLLEDLYLHIEKQEFVLTQGTTGQVLRTLVTFPLAFDTSPNSLFAFLSMLGVQNEAMSLSWFWALPQGHRPRVTLEDVVISPEQWSLNRNDFLNNFWNQDFQNYWKLPDRVFLNEAGRKLPLSLKNKFLTKSILKSGTQSKSILLEEVISEKGFPVAEFANDSIASEILFYGTFAATKNSSSGDKKLARATNSTQLLNSFIPSELGFRNWTLEGSAHVLNSLLQGEFGKWIRLHKSLFLRFYFLFYGGSKNCELRIRFWLKPHLNIKWPQFLMDLQNRGELNLLEKPFEREFKTYGSEENLTKYWQLSGLDSGVFLDYFSKPNLGRARLLGPEPSSNDVLFLLAGIFHYLETAGFHGSEGLQVINSILQGRIENPHFEKAKESAAKWFRDHRQEIDLCLKDSGPSGVILKSWKKDQKKRTRIFQNLSHAQKLHLVSRMIHMNCLRHGNSMSMDLETFVLFLIKKYYLQHSRPLGLP